MNKKIILLMFSLGFVSGCASTSMYIDDTSQSKKQDSVRLHLQRASGLAGSGNAILITDTGKGAQYNSEIIKNSKKLIYLGPIDDKKDLFGNNPRIGSTENFCGIDQDKLKALLQAGSFTKIEDANHCPSEYGEYKFIHPKTVEQINLLVNSSKNEDRKIATQILEILDETIYESSIFVYNPASTIAEISSGDTVSWARPAGRLQLTAIICLVSCDGEENGHLLKPQPPFSIFPGKEYFVLLDVEGLIISDRPFE